MRSHSTTKDFIDRTTAPEPFTFPSKNTSLSGLGLLQSGLNLPGS